MRRPRPAIDDPAAAGLVLLARSSFAIAGIGAIALLLELRGERYKGRTMEKRRPHKFRPEPRRPNECLRCAKTLDGGPHIALRCKCPWRVGNERCVCSRRRDRFTDASCIWCRDGDHFTAFDRDPDTLTETAR